MAVSLSTQSDKSARLQADCYCAASNTSSASPTSDTKQCLLFFNSKTYPVLTIAISYPNKLIDRGDMVNCFSMVPI